MQKTKKDLSFFVFSQVCNHQFIQKTKKTLSFFSFFKVMTKKTKKTRGTPKKNKHEPQTKHSLKNFVFLVFWFSRGFLVFPMASLLKRSQIADSSNSFLFLFGFLNVLLLLFGFLNVPLFLFGFLNVL